MVRSCAEGNSGEWRKVKERLKALEHRRNHHETVDNTQPGFRVQRREKIVVGVEGTTVLNGFIILSLRAMISLNALVDACGQRPRHRATTTMPE